MTNGITSESRRDRGGRLQAENRAEQGRTEAGPSSSCRIQRPASKSRSKPTRPKKRLLVHAQCLGGRNTLALGESKLTVESRSALVRRTVFPNRAPPNSCRMASSRPKHSVGRLTTSNHDETTREHPKSIQSIQKPSVSIQSAKRVGPTRRLSNALLFASKEAVGRCTTRRVTHEYAR